MWIQSFLLLFASVCHYCLAKHPLISNPSKDASLVGAGKIDVWIPCYKNAAWAVLNIRNMIDLARHPSSLDIRVVCMTPDKKCAQLQRLLDVSFAPYSVHVHDVSDQCTR